MFSSSGDGRKPETDVLKARVEITGMKATGTKTGASEGELEEGELYATGKGNWRSYRGSRMECVRCGSPKRLMRWPWKSDRTCVRS